MPMHQQIGQCIQQCVQAANQLRSVSNALQDNRAREMSTSGAVHIEMCIHECEEAVHHIQTTGRF